MPSPTYVVCALRLFLLAVSHQAAAQDKALDILPHYTTPAVELHIIVNRPSATMGEAVELSFTIFQTVARHVHRTNKHQQTLTMVGNTSLAATLNVR